MYLTLIAAALANSSVRTLSQQEELPLLRDHLLRLDRLSRRDRFHGFMDDSFIERYAEKCANDGTVIIDVTKYDQAEFATSWAESTLNAVRAVVAFNRAYWRMLLRMAGGAPTE